MLLAVVALLLVACLTAPESLAHSTATTCGLSACRDRLAVSLSAEAAAGEGEEGEGEEAGEEEGEGSEEDGEAAAGEDEESASSEAEAEEEEETRHAGKRRAGKGPRKGAIVLSSLSLTSKSVAALKHGPTASRIEFTFSLTKRMKVLVTLVKQSKAHARGRWTAIPADSLTISAAKGSNRHRLAGHNHLSAGRYRLTLRPTQGRSRSIYVNVRG